MTRTVRRSFSGAGLGIDAFPSDARSVFGIESATQTLEKHGPHRNRDEIPRRTTICSAVVAMVVRRRENQ